MSAALPQRGDVGRSFGGAAQTYDQAAQLQRKVCGMLAERTLTSSVDMATVVDLGCGTGQSRRRLQARLTHGHLLGVDLAPGMLQSAKAAHPDGDWIGADAAALPLADACVDLVYANLSLQWCSDLEAVFRECRRVLRQRGRLCFSTLGPRTLFELREAWANVDDYQHVNSFLPARSVQDALVRAGFSVACFAREILIESHPDVLSLCRGLKAIGAHNINAGRGAGLVGRSRFRAMSAAYEQRRAADGALPASWEIFLVAAEPA